jgi:hypothetical protein
MKEKILGLFFGVYFKYVEFNILIESIINISTDVLNLM